MRARYSIAAFFAITVLITTVWATAQVVMQKPVTPTVLSGGDVGFRVEWDRGGTPVGTIVVKVNGQWVAAELGARRPTNAISTK